MVVNNKQSIHNPFQGLIQRGLNLLILRNNYKVIFIWQVTMELMPPSTSIQLGRLSISSTDKGYPEICEWL